MSAKTKFWMFGIAFSWFMVFLSWRFAHPIEIQADWLFLSLILSGTYLIIKAYRKPKYYSKKTLEQLA